MEHRFDLSGQFLNDYAKLSCQNAALQMIAESFIHNMNRVRTLAMFPIRMVATATISESARIQAILNKGLSVRDPRIIEGDPNYDPNLLKSVEEEHRRIILKWTNEITFDHQAANLGIRGMNLLLEAGEQDGIESAQATMAAMLMGLWTAFESLMQDTWIVAVNAHRKPLADRVLNTLSKEEQQKFVSGKMLSDADYNLQNCMGDILLRKRTIDFQTLENIRNAYKVAFDSQFEQIFEEHNGKLSELEAVRNLFAHKGGFVDKKFKQRMQKVPGLEAMEIGQLFHVNGLYVATNANAVARCATAVFAGVDNWLSENSA